MAIALFSLCLIVPHFFDSYYDTWVVISGYCSLSRKGILVDKYRLGLFQPGGRIGQASFAAKAWLLVENVIGVETEQNKHNSID